MKRSSILIILLINANLEVLRPSLGGQPLIFNVVILLPTLPNIISGKLWSLYAYFFKQIGNEAYYNAHVSSFYNLTPST